MSDFFFRIVDESVYQNNPDEKEELFALQLTDMRKWCEDMIEMCGYNKHISDWFLECVLNDLFAEDSEFPHKLWRHIQDNCMPDEEETDDDDTIVSNIECKKCNNVLPPHTIAEHLTKDHPIHTCPHQVTK